MSADKDISRNISTITAEIGRLNTGIKSLTEQNKLLDKSLNFSAEPFSVLEHKSEALSRAVEASNEKLEKLREKQRLVDEEFRKGNISHKTYDDVANQILRAENELAGFQNELEKTNAEIKNFSIGELGEKFEKAGSAISSAGRALAPFSAIAAGTLAAGAKLTKSAIEQGAAIDDLAQRYQVSATTIQRWQYVAMQCGVEAETLTKAYTKARAAMLDLDSGKMNEQAKAVAALGINIRDFANSEEAFDGIIQALSNMEDGAQQVALANEIFGDKLATVLLPLLNAGGDVIQEFERQFSELGAMTDDEVSSLAALDDQIYKNKETAKNLGMQIGVSLMPVMQLLVDKIENGVIPKLRSFSEKFSALADDTKNMAAGILMFIAVLAPLLIIGGKVVSGVGKFITMLPKLHSMLTILSSNPIFAVIGAAAVIMGILYTKNEQFRSSVNRLFGTLASVVSIVGVLFEALGKPFASLIEGACAAIEPFINILSYVVELLDRIINGVLTAFGKGWLWGKSDKQQSVAGKTISGGTYVPPDFNFDANFPEITVPEIPTSKSEINESTEINNISNSFVINGTNLNQSELTTAIEEAINKSVLSKKLAFR